jgi:hypothetical protein
MPSSGFSEEERSWLKNAVQGELAWAERWLGIGKMFRKKKATAAPLGQPHTHDDDEMIGNPCKISAPLTCRTSIL